MADDGSATYRAERDKRHECDPSESTSADGVTFECSRCGAEVTPREPLALAESAWDEGAAPIVLSESAWDEPHSVATRRQCDLCPFESSDPVAIRGHEAGPSTGRGWFGQGERHTMTRAERHAHAARAREQARTLIHRFGPDYTRSALAGAWTYDRAHYLYPYARLNRAAVRAELARRTAP